MRLKEEKKIFSPCLVFRGLFCFVLMYFIFWLSFLLAMQKVFSLRNCTKKCGKGEKRFHFSFPQTPLHFAAQHEDDECLNLLLQHGVDVSAKDVRIEKGCVCLFFVCADSIGFGHSIFMIEMGK